MQLDNLAAEHEVHSEKDSITQQLRQFIWWSGITRDIKEYAHSFLTCPSTEIRNYQPPR